MGKLILVSGGARSGKSRYAQQRCEALAGPRAFVATSPITDDEMAARIQRHRESRNPTLWDTVEEPIDLARVIAAETPHRVLLIDCLTLWVSNLLWRGEEQGTPIDEDAVAECTQPIVEACRAADRTVVLVTNEVGFGIVPDNELARRFRDLLGRCNQCFGRAADEVVLVVCGIPVTIKPEQR